APCTSTTVGLAPWEPAPVLAASAADAGADRAAGWAVAIGAAATKPSINATPASRAMIGVTRRRTTGALTAHLLEGVEPCVRAGRGGGRVGGAARDSARRPIVSTSGVT